MGILDPLRRKMFNSVKESLEDSDYDLRVLLTDHKIEIDFVDPDKTNYAWDDTFANGCVFRKNSTNSLVPDPDDNKLISTQRYRSLMKSTVISDIVNIAKGDRAKLLKILAILVLATLGVGTISLMVQMGVI